MNPRPLIGSYLPELMLLRNKAQGGVRVMREDCAVLDAVNGFSPIAMRFSACARRDAGQAPFSFDRNTRIRLRGLLRQGLPILLDGTEDSSLLILPTLLEATGTVMAIRAPLSAPTLLRALRLCGRTDVICAIDDMEDTHRAPSLTQETAEWLEELLFYTDRILGNDRDIGLLSRALLIAAFTGCRPDTLALPCSPLPISSRDGQRLTAFLLCVFLSLRTERGRLVADASMPENIQAPICLRVGLTEAEQGASETPISMERLPFLSLPAFRDIRIVEQEGRLILETAIARRADSEQLVLRSSVDSLRWIRIELMPTEACGSADDA